MMRLSLFKNTLFLWVLLLISCGTQNKEKNAGNAEGIVIEDKMTLDKPLDLTILNGADQPEVYKAGLTSSRIGLVANQTSRVYNHEPSREQIEELNGIHLVDFLKVSGFDLVKVFAPEHGFRGTADAGELVKDGIDTPSGLPIISLYGKNKKPSKDQLAGIDVMVFDIQDVGARFYTYISTLHYVMEACAENNIPLIVFDRPNPNGHYIDGPVLEPQHSSFVGMHPVPVVHGMTMGEYAQMINGEGWLAAGVKCKLRVIPLQNYTHDRSYSLPVKPSPNLPNDVAINLYPSLCFFEGTYVSAGRGTDTQFQVFGAPDFPHQLYPYSFTPESNEGAKYPKFESKLCFGKDLSEHPPLDRIKLEWLIDAYVATDKKEDFFNDFFTKLAGTEKLRQQIEQGYTYKEIRASWVRDLEVYKLMRQKYLLYD